MFVRRVVGAALLTVAAAAGCTACSMPIAGSFSPASSTSTTASTAASTSTAAPTSAALSTSPSTAADAAAPPAAVVAPPVAARGSSGTRSNPAPAAPGGAPAGGGTAPGGDTGGAASHGPAVASFSASKPTCAGSATADVTLTWKVTGADGATLAVDGLGEYGRFGASGSQTLDFPCDAHPHTYNLWPTGAQDARRTITVTARSTAPKTGG